MHAVSRYVTGHWRGEHSLKWSFWINLVFIRVLVFAVQNWLGPAEGQDFHEHQFAVLILAFVFHGILFVWQAVGVVRASEVHVRERGYMAPAWATQLPLIISVFWVGIFALEAWQMTLQVPDDPRKSRGTGSRAGCQI